MTLLGLPLQRFPLPAAGVRLPTSLPLVVFGDRPVSGSSLVRAGAVSLRCPACAGLVRGSVLCAEPPSGVRARPGSPFI